MRKHAWITAVSAGLALTAAAGTYAALTDGEVTVSSLCAPLASTPEYVAAHAPTVVIGTVTGPTRYTPDTADPATGVQVVTLTVEKTLKGSTQDTLTLAQSVTRTAQHTYTTDEPVYQPLTSGRRYAVAVLDQVESGGRWVWGAERATGAADDDRWADAVAAKVVLPTGTCDDTSTITSTPTP
ncbi:hypothetical protein [Streptomyces sp. NBC_01237]|uniref:hypothetical protein n=1 Tax=Streptomyces sp. NBC_01237 TaxID=2903790 RepID=UPI002DD9E924|nr:hypothetical protein [Streptomyces sp. NBC_01237]WRZ77745.1 hypothetical protein OG251_39820 [Streptomyces sp. NBC_01237]